MICVTSCIGCCLWLVREGGRRISIHACMYCLLLNSVGRYEKDLFLQMAEIVKVRGVYDTSRFLRLCYVCFVRCSWSALPCAISLRSPACGRFLVYPHPVSFDVQQLQSCRHPCPPPPRPCRSHTHPALQARFSEFKTPRLCKILPVFASHDHIDMALWHPSSNFVPVSTLGAQTSAHSAPPPPLYT